MSKACFDCPHNIQDCDRPHCVHADGVPRGVVVVNRQLPGPSIQVKQISVINKYILSLIVKEIFQENII